MIVLCGDELSTIIGMGCVELSVESMTLSFSVVGLFSTIGVVKVVECGSFVKVVIVVPPSVGDLSVGLMEVVTVEQDSGTVI